MIVTSNFRVITFAIIGVITYVICLSSVAQIDVQAQGTANQSMNAPTVESGTLTEAGSEALQNASLPAVETGTVVSPSEEERGYVKVATTCRLNNMSCAGIADDLFRIYPSIFIKNRLLPIGDFSPSERGRIVEIEVYGDKSIPYEIKQLFAAGAPQNLFHAYPYHSYDCEGEIKAGQTKQCKIDTVLYLQK